VVCGCECVSGWYVVVWDMQLCVVSYDHPLHHTPQEPEPDEAGGKFGVIFRERQRARKRDDRILYVIELIVKVLPMNPNFFFQFNQYALKTSKR